MGVLMSPPFDFAQDKPKARPAEAIRETTDNLTCRVPGIHFK
jgi:hypothetical protein